MLKVFAWLWLSSSALSFAPARHAVSARTPRGLATQMQAAPTQAKGVVIVTPRARERAALVAAIGENVVGSIVQGFGGGAGDSGAALVDAEVVDVGALAGSKSVFFLFEEDGHLRKDVEEIRQACRYTLFVPEASAPYRLESGGDRVLEATRLRFQALVEGAHGRGSESSTSLQAGQWSHFLSLTLPQVDDALALMPQLRPGQDALELRVDLLSDTSGEPTVSMYTPIKPTLSM
ncbi:hypothetical protein B484DRAFT_222590 [Ochromonadaceae sp. CCMP2298]|nr:hypothetical protein B484DRAFT_222590 [Ochromonadaceae sp. CCMP2298]